MHEPAVFIQPDTDGGDQLFQPSGALRTESGIRHPVPDHPFFFRRAEIPRIITVQSAPCVNLRPVIPVDFRHGHAVGFRVLFSYSVKIIPIK